MEAAERFGPSRSGRVEPPKCLKPPRLKAKSSSFLWLFKNAARAFTEMDWDFNPLAVPFLPAQGNDYFSGVPVLAKESFAEGREDDKSPFPGLACCLNQILRHFYRARGYPDARLSPRLKQEPFPMRLFY
jgi:hypothetical protein